ncbi:MAG: hypothetical protein BWY79_00030 [Actinobacteria bacterium ADurb.Bin444]|nr:MAG: hypothetical protein BWY79_00030 [Actinobacteria bacterium ADurb.Bin444]
MAHGFGRPGGAGGEHEFGHVVFVHVGEEGRGVSVVDDVVVADHIGGAVVAHRDVMLAVLHLTADGVHSRGEGISEDEDLAAYYIAGVFDI